MSNSIIDQLGTPWGEGLKAAGLAGWNLRAAHVYAVLPERDIRLDRIAVMRTNPDDRTKRDILGEFSPEYRIITNEDLGHYMQQLTESFQERWDTLSMGSMEGGKKVFFAIKRDRPLKVEIPSKPLSPMVLDVVLLGINSHDGTVPLTLSLGLVERETGALLSVAAKGQGSPLWKFQTRSMDSAPAVQFLEVWITEGVAALRAELTQMASEAMLETEVEQLALSILGTPAGASGSTLTRYENKLASFGRHLPVDREIRRLDLLVAACAWFDFSSPVRKAKLGQLTPMRASRALLDTKFKTSAFNKLRK